MATSLLRSTLRSANRWTTGLQKRHPMGSIFREQIRPITTKLNLRNKVQNTTNITPVNSVNAFAAKRSYAEQVPAEQNVLGKQTLTPKQEAVLREEKDFLTDLVITLKEIGATKEDIETVKRSIIQLEDLFLLVVVGEFNSGKSSFLNALLGNKWLQEGVTPTTSKINILRYGDTFKVNEKYQDEDGEDKVFVNAPVEWLKQISLVDTPGTNAVVKGHQEITQHFVPRSDLVLFVTSSDRAFTESERQFMEKVKEYKKKLIIVLSKIDLFEEESQLEEVKNFVREQSRQLFDFEPEIFPVSGKMALRAKKATADIKEPNERIKKLAENPMWQISRFGDLESYILNTLNPEKRTVLKLKNPLGVATYIVKRYNADIIARVATIEGDVETLKTIDDTVAEFKKDMNYDFKYHQEHVDNVLLRMAERGEAWFDEKIGISRIFSLMKGDEVKREFEKEVVGNFSTEVEKYVSDLIDWNLERHGKFWSRIMEHVTHKLQQLDSDKVVGKVNTQFHYDRSTLLQGMGQGSKRVVEDFDKEKQVKKLSAQVASAVYQTAAMEIGAVGLVGFFLTMSYQATEGALTSFALLDITGIVGAGAIAATGLAILPYKRTSLKKKFREEIENLRKRMRETLETHFSSDLDRGVRRIGDNLAPYTQFVAKEQQKLKVAEEKLKASVKKISELDNKIETIFNK